MKKKLYTTISLFFIIILTGCSIFSEGEPITTHSLLSENEDRYLLFVVEEPDTNDWRYILEEENNIFKVKTIITEFPLEEVNEQYKFLELEKSPAFVVFDNKEMLYKTYDEKELIDFLKTN